MEFEILKGGILGILVITAIMIITYILDIPNVGLGLVGMIMVYLIYSFPIPENKKDVKKDVGK